MKKIFITLILSTIAVLSGCSDSSNPITPTEAQLSGTWHADQVQMVHAPNTLGHSSEMKLQLQQLGSMPASLVGWADLSFGTGTKWNSQSIGSTEDLGEISFIDSQNGFIILKNYGSQNYKFYSTTDGGNTWNIRTVSLFNYSYQFSISFIDALNGWSIGNVYYRSVLAKTNDNGINWTQIYDFGQYSNITDFCFINSSLGFAVNYNYIYKTTNGGVNWSLQNSPVSGFKIKFINSQTGFVAGSTGIMKTTDEGATWLSLPLSFDLSSFDCKDANLLFASGRSNGISVVEKSVNGGSSWTTISNVNVEDYNGRNGFDFIDANTGFIVSGNVIMKTNWSQEFCEYFTRLNDVYVKDENNVIITADDGKLWKRTSSTEPQSWTLQGQVTNSQIKGITHADNEVDVSGGIYTVDGTNVVFTVLGYSEGMSNSNDITTGNGIFTSSGNLVITLNFANDEQWKVNFKR
jgi:photosystem II stability/assembly factor-like uncharacterized protein